MCREAFLRTLPVQHALKERRRCTMRTPTHLTPGFCWALTGITVIHVHDVDVAVVAAAVVAS